MKKIPVEDIEMDEHLKDQTKNADQERPIDPLRREFVPIEKKNTDGTYSFRTKDKRQYRRMLNGEIRRVR